MASGKSKQIKSANEATNNAVKAVKPINYSDPFGSLSKGVFTPNEDPNLQQARLTGGVKINEMVQGIPTSITPESLYNNPFYDSLYGSYKRNIDQQRTLDTKELDNNLNARNQVGSSYDALMRSNQARDYNNQYLNADTQAHQGAASNYLQAYQSSLAGLAALRGDQSQYLDQLYMPAKIATGYQSAVTPLQTAAAGAYNTQANNYFNQPTFMDNLLKYYSATAQAAGAAMGGA